VAVAGIVVCRQRPGTAKGVIFLTLEDETGTANIVVWAKIFERFRRAVIAGRCLRITGRLQRDGEVVHLVAETIEDISALLDEIVGIDAPPGEAPQQRLGLTPPAGPAPAASGKPGEGRVRLGSRASSAP
jgi:error-prone DNA polymerase